MVTAAIAANPLTLKWNGVEIAEITNVSGPGVKTDYIPVTPYSSTNAFKEFIAGLREGNDVSFEANFLPGDTTGQIAFITDVNAGTKREAIITHAVAGITWTFQALASFDFKEPLEAQLAITGTLKITGKPVLAITASANLTTLTGIEENVGAALTFTPAFAGATKSYNVAINTASTWVKFTPTLVGAIITIKTSYDNSEQSVASGAQSGTVAVTDGAITTITLSVKETGKVANVYTVHIYTP